MMRRRVWLILRRLWISFHSLATKYVRQMLTGQCLVLDMVAMALAPWVAVEGKKTPWGRSQSMKKMSIVHWYHIR